MLAQLRIRGFAIVDELTVELAAGMNVLTGETGAGKSIVVDAVGLLRGGRASADWIRTGVDEARVEAVFDLGDAGGKLARGVATRLDAAGIESDGSTLLVRRVLQRTGRGKVFINGALATAATLAEVIAPLIDVAGQHEHQSLTDPVRHLEVLDAFAGLESKRAECAERYEALRAAVAALSDEAGAEGRRAEREDWLRFQVREIDDAKLVAGEEATLAAERDRLRAAERLTAASGMAVDVLYAGDEAVSDRLAGVLRELGPLAAIDAQLAPMVEQLERARVEVDDAAEALRRYGEKIQDDPGRLGEVEDRLALIGRMVRKHASGPGGAGTVATVLERRAEMAEELGNFERRDERRAELGKAVVSARKAALETHGKLSEARLAAGRDLARRTTQGLGSLGMKGAKLDVRIEPRLPREGDAPELVDTGKRMGPGGWDRVELMLSANVGEELRPLSKVASGGELSRVMLALKRVLARADAVTTYLFDEVDAGIGGGVAEVVGRELAKVAAHGQVVCITHLAQIAAFADAHFLVQKRESAGRTATSVTRLGDGEREEEVARMLGGVKITAKTREHAAEMLRAAREGDRLAKR